MSGEIIGCHLPCLCAGGSGFRPARPGELGPRLSGRVTLSLSSLSPRLELLSFGGTVAGKRAEQEELTQG